MIFIMVFFLGLMSGSYIKRTQFEQKYMILEQVHEETIKECLK